ncbi:hypothetical protein DFH09DRAFT_1096750 [Mycena vulgaris]|nr:hypothetical protein DFH09DRAFT_1096750 [Mycena vulgaris]
MRSRITLWGLSSLAQHCAHLTDLQMNFDATPIPEWGCALATYQPQTILRHISVAISRIWTAAAVTAFISRISPNATVDCYPSGGDRELEEAEMYLRKWKEVKILKDTRARRNDAAEVNEI